VQRSEQWRFGTEDRVARRARGLIGHVPGRLRSRMTSDGFSSAACGSVAIGVLCSSDKWTAAGLNLCCSAGLGVAGCSFCFGRLGRIHSELLSISHFAHRSSGHLRDRNGCDCSLGFCRLVRCCKGRGEVSCRKLCRMQKSCAFVEGIARCRAGERIWCWEVKCGVATENLLELWRRSLVHA